MFRYYKIKIRDKKGANINFEKDQNTLDAVQINIKIKCVTKKNHTDFWKLAKPTTKFKTKSLAIAILIMKLILNTLYNKIMKKKTDFRNR